MLPKNGPYDMRHASYVSRFIYGIARGRHHRPSMRSPIDAPRRPAPEWAQYSPRCGAKTRSDGPCRAPAVNGKKRCRMHGGAKGSEAPKGNQNALKHGRFAREAIAEQKALRDLICGFKATLEEIEKR